MVAPCHTIGLLTEYKCTSRTQLFLERPHPETEENRCREPQPNITEVELRESCAWEEGLWESEGSRTLQENVQNQLTWDHRDSQPLNYQLESLYWINLGSLHIYYSFIALSFCVLCPDPNSGTRGSPRLFFPVLVCFLPTGFYLTP